MGAGVVVVVDKILASSLTQLLFFHLSSCLFCYDWNLSPLAFELLYFIPLSCFGEDFSASYCI
jgi:hypothetical protein